MAYYDECPACGATLDPGEKCTCRAEMELYTRKLAALTETEESGQLKLKVG